MRPREEVRRELVQQWLAKAEEDFKVAERLAGEGEAYLSAVGFHAQQAAEKFLKAVLVHHQVEFPKTHDLGEILDLVATVEACLAGGLRDTAGLTDYAVDIRYPGDFPEMTAEDGKAAVSLAARVREAVREKLGPYLLGNHSC